VGRLAGLHEEVQPQRNIKDVNNVYGYTVAQGLVQVLKQAGDNLTRENVMKQAASLDITLPMLLPGVNVKTGRTTSTRSSVSS
jgi:branched-chain amino acid transport system substrate-binding protein